MFNTVLAYHICQWGQPQSVAVVPFIIVLSHSPIVLHPDCLAILLI